MQCHVSDHVLKLLAKNGCTQCCHFGLQQPTVLLSVIRSQVWDAWRFVYLTLQKEQQFPSDKKLRLRAAVTLIPQVPLRP